MSSIYIPDMEMPLTCLTCDFHKCAGGVGDYCLRTKRRLFRFKNRPKNCPLLELPAEHGRLIDAEPIMKFIQDGLNRGEFGNDVIQVMTEIQYASTIIPAEVRTE